MKLGKCMACGEDWDGYYLGKIDQGDSEGRMDLQDGYLVRSW